MRKSDFSACSHDVQANITMLTWGEPRFKIGMKNIEVYQIDTLTVLQMRRRGRHFVFPFLSRVCCGVVPI